MRLQTRCAPTLIFSDQLNSHARRSRPLTQIGREFSRIALIVRANTTNFPQRNPLATRSYASTISAQHSSSSTLPLPQITQSPEKEHVLMNPFFFLPPTLVYASAYNLWMGSQAHSFRGSKMCFCQTKTILTRVVDDPPLHPPGRCRHSLARLHDMSVPWLVLRNRLMVIVVTA